MPFTAYRQAGRQLLLLAGAVLQRFSKMSDLNLLTSCEISHRARHFQYAMEGPGAEPHLLHRTAHQPLACVI